MNIIRKINWKQPKYVLPAILYPLLLISGYLIFDIFDTEVAEKDNGLQTTEYLNSQLPDAKMRESGIGSKYENMVKSYGHISDFSAVENIDRDSDKETTEDYDSKYTDEDLALLEREAAARTAELERYADTTRISRAEQRQHEALEELNRALAEARLKGQTEIAQNKSKENEEHQDTMKTTVPVTGNIEASKVGINALDDNDAASQVVKKVKVSSDYFNTITQNESEPKLIKAIIDEDVKAVDGSRVRLRLLDDVEINEVIVPKGSYLYAEMSGFGSQRVKGSVKSLLVEDELIKVNLSLYDTDGLEGLYVPGSSFRQTSKDVASSALSSSMNINNGTANGNSFGQWGMQAVQNAYQKTSNAISKAISKNKVKLKYGTFVYLVNSKTQK